MHKILILANPYKGRPHALNGVEKDAESIRRLSKMQKTELAELTGEFSAMEAYSFLQRHLAGLKNTDTVHIYYSGHGTIYTDLKGKPNEALFCEKNAQASLILDKDLKQFLKSVTMATVICLFDSCYSGGMSREVRYGHLRFVDAGDALPQRIAPKLVRASNYRVYYGAACRADQVAYDFGADFGGALTGTLLQAVDENPARPWTWAELFARMRNELIQFQEPTSNIPKTRKFMR